MIGKIVHYLKNIWSYAGCRKLTMTPGKMNKKDIESLKAFDFTESEISEK